MRKWGLHRDGKEIRSNEWGQLSGSVYTLRNYQKKKLSKNNINKLKNKNNNNVKKQLF